MDWNKHYLVADPLISRHYGSYRLISSSCFCFCPRFLKGKDQKRKKRLCFRQQLLCFLKVHSSRHCYSCVDSKQRKYLFSVVLKGLRITRSFDIGLPIQSIATSRIVQWAKKVVSYNWKQNILKQALITYPSLTSKVANTFQNFYQILPLSYPSFPTFGAAMDQLKSGV